MELLNTSAVTSMLRRAAWIRWLPPIATQSPSPMMTMTLRPGSAALAPVATASARPWAVCTVDQFRYVVMRPAQPMPAITQVRSGSRSSDRTASIRALVTMPFEQPGHQSVLGVRR